MTGYGAARRAQADGAETGDAGATVEVEIRSVNGRFLELKSRQPFGPAVETRLRKRVEARLGRGRVDLWVHLRREAEEGSPELVGVGAERSRLEESARALAVVREILVSNQLEVGPVNPLELLRFSAQLREQSGTRLEAPPFLEDLVDEALDRLVAMRETEGESLRGVLAGLLDVLAEQTDRLQTVVEADGPRLAHDLRGRLGQAVETLGGAAPDPARLAQEVALVVARGDVAEEFARIASHLEQARGVLAGPAESGQGKTLDFLAQEFFREVTTIGSKITSHDGSGIVIEAKRTVERIREQVQNVE